MTTEVLYETFRKDALSKMKDPAAHVMSAIAADDTAVRHAACSDTHMNALRHAQPNSHTHTHTHTHTQTQAQQKELIESEAEVCVMCGCSHAYVCVHACMCLCACMLVLCVL